MARPEERTAKRSPLRARHCQDGTLTVLPGLHRLQPGSVLRVWLEAEGARRDCLVVGGAGLGLGLGLGQALPTTYYLSPTTCHLPPTAYTYLVVGGAGSLERLAQPRLGPAEERGG